jgi:hypothetical protein
MSEPVFLLSSMRAGSTLLVRMLGVHPGMGVSSEPHFLFPNLLPFGGDPFGQYADANIPAAMREFIQSLEGSEERWLAALAAFSRDLYASAGQGKRYMLDKTPVYCLVADSLARAFPTARILILWRNPLAIMASYADTFFAGRFDLHHLRPYLRVGIPKLIDLARSGHPGVLAVQYERLVAEPETEMARVWSHLGLEPPASLLDSLPGVKLAGNFHDPKSDSPAFATLRKDRRDSWKASFHNPYRRKLGSAYLRWLGAERLALMGYNLDELLGELDACNGLLSDLAGDLSVRFRRRVAEKLMPGVPAGRDFRR